MPKDATIDPLDKLFDQLKEFKGLLTPKEQAEIDSLDAVHRKKRHLKIKKLLERAKKRAPVPMPNMKEGNKRKTGVIA
jgi:hypothetical protein